MLTMLYVLDFLYPPYPQNIDIVRAVRKNYKKLSNSNLLQVDITISLTVIITLVLFFIPWFQTYNQTLVAVSSIMFALGEMVRSGMFHNIYFKNHFQL